MSSSVLIKVKEERWTGGLGFAAESCFVAMAYGQQHGLCLLYLKDLLHLP